MIKPVGSLADYRTPRERAEKHIGEIRGLLGKRMFRATLEAMPQIGKDRRAVLDDCRGRRRLPIAYTLDQVELLVDLVTLCREKKRDVRPEVPDLAYKLGPWEAGTLEHRFRVWLIGRARQAIYQVFRRPAGRLLVGAWFTYYPSERPGLTVEKMPGQRFGWRRPDVVISATLPKDWLQTVYRRGLATHGGRFVVSAREVAPGVYDATWGRQGRGYSIIMESGRIEL